MAIRRQPLRYASEVDLTKAVLDYVAEYSEASDTLTGIAEWWLGQQQGPVDREKLSNVLRELTAQGLLEEIWSPTGARYRVRKRPRSASLG